MKTLEQVVTIIGTAILLSILLYYYYGGTAYIQAFTSGITDISGALMNFRSAYPVVTSR